MDVSRSHDPWLSHASASLAPSCNMDSRVVIVMPAYNAARTLAATIGGIERDLVHDILLVDDHSHDGTLDVASKLGIRTIGLPHNVGYGGNQKVCYLEALRLGADIVVMLHPDGQYDPAVIPDLIAPLQRSEADLVLGSRMLVPGAARAGRMPMYRYVSNKVLTAIENTMMGTHFSELHTGYRAYSRRFLEAVPFLRNSTRFTSTPNRHTRTSTVCFRSVACPNSLMRA